MSRGGAQEKEEASPLRRDQDVEPNPRTPGLCHDGRQTFKQLNHPGSSQNWFLGIKS